jgi:hypothetical protein
MPKLRLPPDIDCLEEFERMQVLLEMTKQPLTKCVTKGTKQAGINARKMLRDIQHMARDIIDASLVKQKEIRAKKPIHGNANGPGIKAMQAARKRILEGKKTQQDDST